MKNELHAISLMKNQKKIKRCYEKNIIELYFCFQLLEDFQNL